MAKRRVNKKVAIIGFIVLMFFVMGIVVIALHFRKDPLKALENAEISLAQKDYKNAGLNYARAYGYAKDDKLKISILFKFADFHLIDSVDVDPEDLSFHEPDWGKVLACWSMIINIDPKNVQARTAQLNYFYEVADGGNDQAWDMIETRTSELIEVLEEKGQTPDPYILRAKARAMLMKAKLGQTTDREKSINEAINELEKLREIIPKDVDIYLYLADAALVKGQVNSAKGVLNATKNAEEKAEVILYRAVDIAPDDPKAYINLLNARLRNIPPDDLDAMQELRDEFGLLAEQFSSNAEVYAALARVYLLKLDTYDDAMEAITKAIELDDESVSYRMLAADLNYRKSSVYKDKKYLNTAIELINNALTMPDAQDVPGPLQFKHRSNRFALLSLLATWYIEQAVETDKTEYPEQKQQWTEKAEEVINHIKQIIGTEENVGIIKWRGMLLLAKGDTANAVRQMYNAYEQLKVTDDNDPVLSYALANIFRGNSAIGARKEFLERAIFKRPSIASYKPEALLDYMEVLVNVYDWKGAMFLVDVYENTFPANDRSQRIRIVVYIKTGEFDLAEEALSMLKPDEVETVKLRLLLIQARLGKAKTARIADSDGGMETKFDRQADLEKLRSLHRELLEKLQKMKPDDMAVTLSLCRNYVDDGKIDKAKTLIDEYLADFPDDRSAKIYKRLLLEPDPKDVSRERTEQLNHEVLMSIPDELDRHIALGLHYSGLSGQADSAMAEFKKALEISPNEERVIDSLFDIALRSKDMELAEQMAEVARDNNIDKCDGNLFSAKLYIAKKDYQAALERLNDCINALPVFAYGYFLRSQVNNKLDNYVEALEDARTSARVGLLDGKYAKQIASLLYQRNLRLDRNVSDIQIDETVKALARAIVLNFSDMPLRRLYAEYVSRYDPEKALRVLRQTREIFPTANNIVAYAKMAMKLSLDETNPRRRNTLAKIAGTAYEEAYRAEPENKTVLSAYSNFLRVMGRQKEAEDILTNNTESLWRFYASDGQYGKAKGVLDELYRNDPSDEVIVKALMLVTSNSGEKDELKKYSEELLVIDNTKRNQLLQIQMYLEVELFDEAEVKLDSFTRENPEDAAAILFKAWLAMRKGQLPQALELIDRNLKVAPENAAGWRLRGQVNKSLGNFNQAVEDLQKAKNINPDLKNRVLLASAYRRVGQLPAAIGELVDVLKSQQSPKSARIMLEELYLQAGRKSELPKFYTKTLEKYPDSAFWRFRAGKYALDEARYAQAEKLLKESWDMSEKEKKDSVILDMYLESLFKSRKYKKLVNYSAQYLDTEFASVVYAQAAQAFYKSGSRAKAVAYYHTSLEKSESDDRLAMGILDNMLNIAGQQEVANWCNEKLKEDPDLRTANLMMFRLAQRAGKFDKAIGHIDNFLVSITPQSPVWVEYMTKKSNILAIAYVATSQKKYLLSAIKVFERILEKKPDDPAVLNDLAYLLADNNEQIDKAVEYAKRASQSLPNDGNVLDTYAYALYRQGQFEKAEELFKTAIEIFERNSQKISWTVYDHLGAVQEQLDRKADAADSYSKALQLAGNKIPKRDKEKLTKSIGRVLQ